MPGNNLCLRSSSASSSHGSGGRALSSSSGHLRTSQWKYLQLKSSKLQFNASNRETSSHIVPMALPGKGQEREHASAANTPHGIGRSVQPLKHAIYEKRRYVIDGMSMHCRLRKGHVSVRIWRCLVVTYHWLWALTGAFL